jgi:hypothetical protein
LWKVEQKEKVKSQNRLPFTLYFMIVTASVSEGIFTWHILRIGAWGVGREEGWGSVGSVGREGG